MKNKRQNREGSGKVKLVASNELCPFQLFFVIPIKIFFVILI